MRIPDPLPLNVHTPGLEQQIRTLPPAPGIYALRTSGKNPHIAWSANLPRRLLRLLVSSYTSPSSTLGKLRDSVESVECWPVGSKLEASLLLYEVTKAHFPTDYVFRLRMRMPWFVGLTVSDSFPRLTLTNRIPRKSGPLFGPFRTRDLAQFYLEEVQSLFQIRRCTEALVPAPEHPGCIYGEMNQCLRPCQSAVTPDEYGSEAHRVADFLATNGKSATAILTAARQRAVTETDFEQAAHIHKRIEKMTAAAGARDEVIADSCSLNGVALTRSIDRREVRNVVSGDFRLWPMREGYWQEPLTLNFSLEDSAARSLDRELREQLNQALAQSSAQGQRLDHLALFSRWYYSSWRDGHWFPFRTLADLNYRRLVREISNFFKTPPPASR